MEALIHPFVLSFDSAPINCLSVVTLSRTHGMAGATVPLATPRCIVQNLIDYLKMLVSGNPNALQMASKKPWLVWTAFASAPRKEQSWAERSLVSIPTFSKAAIDGEGWIFLLSDDGALPQSRKTWGFIRFHSSSRDRRRAGHSIDNIGSHSRPDGVQIIDGTTQTAEIHGLRPFLQIICDGQEKASEDAVKQLEGIMDRLHQEQNVDMMTFDDLRQEMFDVMRRR
ncbi:hypothetical protein NEOLEDRAFT_1245766 [Neolentinus lepideus HHB14362 ss-1]|uniref:Uncharacterized protein n=1 Tax=Neolentinus lepideus HHB14362 ss-1 TaxID=1314782 RepID=A0A165NDI7_9AGAM|nr:hypothetical protein NEOLEDRAFT_1245766 [Neolentinus lepideus HHB14362 ss-1]